MSRHRLSRGLAGLTSAFTIVLTSCSVSSTVVQQEPSAPFSGFGRVVVEPFIVEGKDDLQPALKKRALWCAAWIRDDCLSRRLADKKWFKDGGPTVTLRGSLLFDIPDTDFKRYISGGELIADLSFVDEAGRQVAEANAKASVTFTVQDSANWADACDRVAMEIIKFIEARYDRVERPK